MKKKILGLALEAVSFQRDTAFFEEINALYDELFKRSGKEKITIADLQPLIGIVNRHTNLVIELVDTDHNSYDAYTLTPDIDANSPTAVLIYRWGRVSEEGLRKISKARGAIGGYVDLEKGKVGGVFTEFKVPVCIGLGWFNARQYLTAPQLAAITLHEVGHIFTDLEMLSEACTVNCIMQAMAQDWLLSDRVKRTKLLDAATEAANMAIDPRTRDNLVNYDSPDNVVSVLLSPDVFTPRSIFGTLALDDTSCEALADQYAARMGAGDHLAKALLVFYKYASGADRKSRTSAFFANLMTLLNVGYGIAAVVTGYYPAAILVGFLGFFNIIMSSDEQFGDVYDTPRNRIRRLVVETRGTLKDKKIRPEYAKRILTSLEELEKSMEQFSNSNRLFEGLINTVWRSRGRLIDIRRRQELIESLGNNVLFQTAAQLRNKE